MGFLDVSKSVVIGSCWIGLDRICTRIGHMASTDDLDRQGRHTKSTSARQVRHTIKRFWYSGGPKKAEIGVRPGGMRVAIESAALVIDKRWCVKSKAQVHRNTTQLFAEISDPLHIPSFRPRAFRRADLIISTTSSL